MPPSAVSQEALRDNLVEFKEGSLMNFLTVRLNEDRLLRIEGVR